MVIISLAIKEHLKVIAMNNLKLIKLVRKYNGIKGKNL